MPTGIVCEHFCAQLHFLVRPTDYWCVAKLTASDAMRRVGEANRKFKGKRGTLGPVAIKTTGISATVMLKKHNIINKFYKLSTCRRGKIDDQSA